jgi:preprotein translocase subunit YajC
MKRATIFALVAALLVALTAGTALAKGKPADKGSKGKGPAVVTYVFKGTVTEVGEGSLLVDVEKGNRAARPFAGQQVRFAVTEATKVELNEEEAALSDLQAGDKVVVQSKAKKGATSFEARVVSAERPEPVEAEPAL